MKISIKKFNHVYLVYIYCEQLLVLFGGEKFKSECHQYKFCVFIFWMEWALYFEKCWSQFRFSILVKISPLKWIEDFYHQPDILKNLARERNDSRLIFSKNELTL